MSIDTFRRRLARKGASIAGQSVTEDGEGLLDSLNALKKQGGDLMGRVAVSVKEATGSNLLRQAVAARKRGNLAAAFYLAKEEYEAQPDEPESAHFYWNVAVAYEQPGEAVAAVVGLIKKNVIRVPEVSTGCWIELSSQVPDALIDPSTLARMIPHLVDQLGQAGEVVGADGEEKEDSSVLLAIQAAIRGVVDDRNRELLTGGVAMHVAELARELDPTSALAAARFALECEDVHENKRDRLRILIHELDPDDPETNPARNHPLYEKELGPSSLSGDEITVLKTRLSSSPMTEPAKISADTETARPAPIPIDVGAEAPVFVDLKCVTAEPTELTETMLFVQLEGDRRSGIQLDKVQAVAVAEVEGMAEVPVVLVDLLMNIRNDDDTPLRIARLRSDEFDALALMPEEPDSNTALQAFLGKLMEFTRAIPLPDPEAALGLVVPHFDSLDAYEQQVLQVRR